MYLFILDPRVASVVWNLTIFSNSPLKMFIWSIIFLPVYLSPSLLFGHRPSVTVCQWSCSGPSFLISSMNYRSFWCRPYGHNAWCSLVSPSFPYPGNSSRGPVLWHLMLVCKGWFHLLPVLGCFPSRGLFCWWYLASGSEEFFSGSCYWMSELSWQFDKIVIF